MPAQGVHVAHRPHRCRRPNEIHAAAEAGATPFDASRQRRRGDAAAASELHLGAARRRPPDRQLHRRRPPSAGRHAEGHAAAPRGWRARSWSPTRRRSAACRPAATDRRSAARSSVGESGRLGVGGNALSGGRRQPPRSERRRRPCAWPACRSATRFALPAAIPAPSPEAAGGSRPAPAPTSSGSGSSPASRRSRMLQSFVAGEEITR